MEKSTFEQMRGTYCQEGDYLLPSLTAQEKIPLIDVKISQLPAQALRREPLKRVCTKKKCEVYQISVLHFVILCICLTQKPESDFSRRLSKITSQLRRSDFALPM